MPSAEENAIVQEQIEELHALHLTLGDEKVASFYPPEMEAEKDRFGLAFTHIDGTYWHHGDCEYPCVRDVMTVMAMCGMYNAAGEWAYDVGIPAKSGVSGGIMVAVPNYFGGAFFSPGLDRFGNSVRGVNMCRDLSSRFGLHAYADPEEAMFRRMEPVGPPPGLSEPSS